MPRARVLHVLHHSLPVSDGYAIRTRYLLDLQREGGWEVAAVTSAQHAEWNPEPTPDQERVEGVEHFRTRAHPPSLPLAREWSLMEALSRRLDGVIREWRPDLLHAHSPILCALPALRAARGLPVVYELRDLWENASVDRGKFTYGSPLYRLAQRLEEHAVNRADAVVTICASLREEMARRCPRQRRLHVVANGVDIQRFTPAPPDWPTRRRWNSDEAPLAAYVGAFQAYEGLDVLLRAWERLLRAWPRPRLLLVGGGPHEGALRELAASLELGDRVTFTGRVPHEEVGRLYSIADLLVYPRRYTRTTALTTPLKPLEAMALRKPVLASDVPAVRELIRHGETGWLFPAEDTAALAESAAALLRDEPLRRCLGDAGRAYVEADRQWPALVRGYDAIYAPLLAEAREGSGKGKRR